MPVALAAESLGVLDPNEISTAGRRVESWADGLVVPDDLRGLVP